MDEYRLHGWTFDGTWNRCYPKVSRVGGMGLVESNRKLTSGILLQGVPKCMTDKCIVPNHTPDLPAGQKEEYPLAFCDGMLDVQSGRCISSRQKRRGYDCRDCMRCHDACQGFL